MRRLESPDRAKVLAVLKQASRQSREAAFLSRLYAVLLVSLGFSCYRVAAWLGKDRKTVERWVHCYQELGAKGLRGAARSGRKPSLNPAQLEILGLDLAKPPRQFGYSRERWSGSLLARHVERRFGVALSLRQCQRLLRQLRP